MSLMSRLASTLPAGLSEFSQSTTPAQTVYTRIKWKFTHCGRSHTEVKGRPPLMLLLNITS